MRLFYFLSFILFICLAACKTASKAYEQGDYEDAIDRSIKKLQKNPHDAEAKSLIQKAYTYAVNQHQDQIRILSNSSSDTRWEQMYYHYNQLQDLYQTINRYPATTGLIKATDYSSYVETYRNKAADVHADKGITLMNEDNKQAYRKAWQEFRTALKFKPNDEDLKRKVEYAYDLGLIKIVVVPVDDHNGYYSNAAYSIRRFNDNIIRKLNYESGNSFVKFFPSWDAPTQNILPDEILEMRLGKIRIGQPVDEIQTRKVSKEVVDKEIVYSKDSVIKQYRTIYAKITTTRRTLVSDADLMIAARHPAGKILWTEVVQGRHQWKVEFATYTGDERALSSSDKELLNQRVGRAPDEEAIFKELLNQIENNLTNKVRYYYSHY